MEAIATNQMINWSTKLDEKSLFNQLNKIKIENCREWKFFIQGKLEKLYLLPIPWRLHCVLSLSR